MKKLDILYEDKEIIIINKPNGLLTIANDKNSNNLYHEVRDYVKKQNPRNKIFIVHRLDKDTSGIVLFAKNEKAKKYLQENWNSFTREYIAVIEGIPNPKKAKLVNYLRETKTLFVYVTKNPKDSKKAITNYEVIASNKKYSLLNISIETGRKNQIRAQLSYIGNPIVGDKKYDAKTSPINRLGLHANKLIFIHPVTHKEIKIESPIPKQFQNIVF